jgi:hypothetical protein
MTMVSRREFTKDIVLAKKIGFFEVYSQTKD